MLFFCIYLFIIDFFLLFVSQTMCLTELNQGLQTLQLNVSDDHVVTSRIGLSCNSPKKWKRFY